VVVRYMPSVSSREFGLRTGELDIIEGLKEEQWMQKIGTFPLVSVKAFAPCEVQMLYFNMTKKPFDDIRVRKAFCYAVARDEVAAFMGKSLAEPIYSAALAPPAPGALTKEEAEKAGTFPLVSVKAFAPCEVQMLYFNMTKKPFDDLRVRKAFCYAVARDEVAAFMGRSLAEPIYSAALAPPAPGALTKEEAEKAGVVYENNLEKAKQLLAEAGYPNGFETEAIVSEMDSSYRKPMLALQAQVKKAGINLKLKVVEHSSFHTLVRQDASPLVYYASWRPNADVYLTRFNHSDSVVAVGKKPDTNFSHYGLVDANGDGKVDSIDTIVEQARWELDAKKQNALWAEAQIQVLKDVSVLPTIKLKYNFPMKSYIDLGCPLEFAWQTYSPQVNEKTRILAH
ncbi:MAG: ABC transporter substrate-binding protein, partial [Syntrophobacteraceae bacterium]